MENNEMTNVINGAMTTISTSSITKTGIAVGAGSAVGIGLAVWGGVKLIKKLTSKNKKTVEVVVENETKEK